MKEAELKIVLEQLGKVLGDLGSGHPCSGCSSCCDCTTTRSFEQSAARHNEAQAFAAAESSKAFVQQQGAGFSQLLSQQQEFQKSINA